MLAIPSTVKTHPAYEPLLSILDGSFATPEELARRWRLTEAHLCNVRGSGRGPAFVKLFGNGSVRYPLSEVIGYEIRGASYHVTQDRLSVALATVPGLDPEIRKRVESHLNGVLYAPAARG